MAHRSDVVQVPENFSTQKFADKFPETVKDPICDQEMSRKESKHVLFRSDNTYYFCSKECMDQFQSGKRRSKAA